MAVGLAEEHGLSVDRQIVGHQVDAMLEILGKRRERLLEGTGLPDRLDAGYDLAALHAGHVLRNDTTDALVHYLALKQRSDGHWTTTLFRLPLNDSAFTATALSLHALQIFSIPGRTTELQIRVSMACRLVSRVETKDDRRLRLPSAGIVLVWNLGSRYEEVGVTTGFDATFRWRLGSIGFDGK